MHLNRTNAIAIGIPLRYMLTGVASLTAVFIAVLWKPTILSTYHYNPQVVAVTHLFVFGWLASVVMGAMYQLIPVALETQLHSERLARVAYWIHLVAFVGMVCTFWIWDIKQAGQFGSLLAIGIGIFIYNIARTLKRVPKRTVVSWAIAAALIWLASGVCAGLYVACARWWDFSPFNPVARMHAHAHLGVVGFFLQITLGVSFRLVPMFLLSDLQNERRAKWSLLLLNFGLAGAFAGILVQAWWKELFSLVLVAGLVLYGVELASMVRERKRKAVDWGIRYFLAGIVLLVPVILLALFLSWPGLEMTVLVGQLENLYGFAGLSGVLTFAVIGMLHKIVPFLVWMKRYSPEIGRRKVPAVADLYSVRLQRLSFWIFLAGFTGNCLGIVLAHSIAIQIASAMMLVAVLIFVLNMAKVLAHLRVHGSSGISSLQFHSSGVS